MIIEVTKEDHAYVVQKIKIEFEVPDGADIASWRDENQEEIEKALDSPEENEITREWEWSDSTVDYSEVTKKENEQC